MHFRLEPGAVAKIVYAEPRRHLRRSRRRLPESRESVLRRRLPLSAVRRHRLGVSLLRGRNEEIARPRPRRRPFAGNLHAHDQQGAGSKARRHDDHDPCLPRQFPLDLHFRRRLRAGGRKPVRPSATTTATSSNTTPSAPAASSRCVSCRRATRSSCSAWSRRRPGALEPRTTSSGASRRRRKIVALEQLCLSPQCGFASTEEGNVLAEDEQWAKLRMIVEVADEVWG